LLQAFYTIRSERQLMEQLYYNLLYRWFVGLGVDDPVWVPTVFTKNRDRLLDAEVARRFLAELLGHKEVSLRSGPPCRVSVDDDNCPYGQR
jgi:transposase